MAKANLEILILGCGYTGQRVARRFLSRGASVKVTTRDPQRLAGVGAEVIRVRDVRAHVHPGMLVLHSIPPDGPADLFDMLADAPARIVYLSSTAVYGAATVVDETTPVDAGTERARARLEVEMRIAAGPWSSLILRPAAIYGPGRGVQESLKLGKYHPGDNFVSRIHVDDLAAHVEAGLLSAITGAFPVADEEPCTAREIAGFCAKLLGIPVPGESAGGGARATGNRRVDGSAIRRVLGIKLIYPSYRVGIPASINPGGTANRGGTAS